MNEKTVGFGVGLDQQTEAVVERTCRQAGLEWTRHSNLDTFALRDDLASAGVLVAPLPEQVEVARLLLERLGRRHAPTTVVFLAERLDLRTIVEALRAGADEVLQWPAETDRLEATIARAVEASNLKLERVAECRQAQEKLDRLSVGEREVLELMLSGKVNKLVAARLGIALRTVENRRDRPDGARRRSPAAKRAFALARVSAPASRPCVVIARRPISRAAGRAPRGYDDSRIFPSLPESSAMVTKNLGMLLLAIWLIVNGAATILGLSFNGMPMVMAALAIAAGVCILIGR